MQDFKMIQRKLTATVIFSVILQANAFSYKDARKWGKKYPDCNGKHQSPVDLDYTGAENSPLINETLKFTNLNKLPTKMTIKNTGHTVEVKANWSGNPPKITGGPLRGNYTFEKATFHWTHKALSSRNDQNDEASLIIQKTPLMDMEMHMFFYKTDLKSFEKAQTQKSGLAAFKIPLKTGFNYPEHLFDNLEKNVHEVQSPNSTAMIPPIRLASILGNSTPPCIFYEGSLDYPPCSESVTWFVLVSDVAITDNLLNEFRKIKLAEGDVSNIRPYQPLNHRELKAIRNF